MYCESNESIYWHTIPYIVDDIGKYEIKREIIIPYSEENIGKPSLPYDKKIYG
jgi:hypothetical protein